MAALAIWAKESGKIVTGSDVAETFPSDPMLAAAGITVGDGFNPVHITSISPPDLVVYTGAHGGADNIEVREAISRGIPVLPHGKALGEAMDGHIQIGVAGSHGKTTTSSMIAAILSRAGADPSYAIGCGEIRGLGLPGHAGKGRIFVAESDEYITDPQHDKTPRFLWQKPHILVVTNVDFDHPDAYKDIDAVRDAFVKLLEKQEGERVVILNKDDELSGPLFAAASNHRVLSFGFNPDSDYVITHVEVQHHRTVFEMVCEGETVATIVLNVPGKHNVSNAAAAAIACHEAGLTWDKISNEITNFSGAKRRFELIGEKNGIVFYDDYAHHPQEIRATIASAKEWYPESRITVVFQPHTYSRTKQLMNEFALAFESADNVLISEIYASAREKDTFGITTETLVGEISKNHASVTYAKTAGDVVRELKSVSLSGDVILFMGAGDIYIWEKEVYEEFTNE